MGSRFVGSAGGGRRSGLVASVVLVTVMTCGREAAASPPEEEPASEDTKRASDPPGEGDDASPTPHFSVSAYVEAFYAYNGNRPSNRITNLRAYDNRHDSFTLSNAVLEVGFRHGPVMAHAGFQVGHTPNAYYADEPVQGGSETAGASSPNLWRYLQQANVGYELPFVRGLRLEGGLFLASVGYEALAVKDNWNWSRATSTLGLLNYLTGVRASYELTEDWDVEVGVYNGWNRIVDDNGQKSVLAHVIYKTERFCAEVAYGGGVERPTGAPEGQPFRHLGEAWMQWEIFRALSVALEVNGGGENTTFGWHTWEAFAAYARVRPLSWLYLAARVDGVLEQRARRGEEESEAILVPTGRVLSGTLTLDLRPIKNLSFRLEGRHDGAADPVYFRGAVAGDGSSEAPFRPNANAQSTLLAGVTAFYP